MKKKTPMQLKKASAMKLKKEEKSAMMLKKAAAMKMKMKKKQ